jgi:hypothetical protein
MFSVSTLGCHFAFTKTSKTFWFMCTPIEKVLSIDILVADYDYEPYKGV